MLTTIQRNIARDIVIMFAVSLCALTTLVMIIGVTREAMNQGLSLIGVIRLIPYAVPNALSIAVPGTALFSVCCVYGRMSADNEFTALQSVGISPVAAMLPAFALTTLLSLATVGLINVAFTWGFHGMQHVVMSSLESIAYRVLERDRNFQHGNLSMSVREVNGRRLVEPAIDIRLANNQSVSINARHAVLTYSEADAGLTLSVTDGCVNYPGRASFHFPDTFVKTIPLDSDPPYDLLTANPSHMPMRDLPTAAVQQNSDITRRASEISVHAGFSVLTSRFDEVSDEESQSRVALLERSRKRLHRVETEMHRRWASGFTCLTLAMVGIPLAIRLKTSDTMTTFGIVFLPTLVVYYPVFALTLDMAKDGRIVACGVWIANGLYVVISVWMMRKTIYSPV